MVLNSTNEKEGRVVDKSTFPKKEKEEYIGAKYIREVVL